MNPGMKGFIQLSRTLFGIDDEVRQMRRDTILSTTGKKLAEAAARILDAYESGASVALAGKKAIQKAGARMPFLSQNVLELPN
jgi:Zn-dependent M16 (insulinase) family peptidase